MNIIFNSLFTCFILFQFQINILAQSQIDQGEIVLREELKKEGFENLLIRSRNDTTIISYENRVYRYEIDALERVSEIIADHLPAGMKIILLPQKNRIPFTKVTVEQNSSTGQAYINADLNPDKLWEELNVEKQAESTYLKPEFILAPGIRLQIGNYDDPFESQLNIVPTFKMNLGRGLTINGELIIPLQNDLGPEGEKVRAGILALNQLIRFPDSYYLSVNAGHFSRNRFGIDIDFRKYFLDGDMSFGLNAGYTGESILYSDSTAFLAPDEFLGTVDMTYRYSPLNLTAEIEYGKYLYGDKSFTVSILRQFGELDIGFFAVFNGNDNNAGVSLSIPIFPAEYMKPGKVSFRTERYFNYSYRAKGFNKIGIKYETKGEIYNKFMHLIPNYIENEFNRIR